MADELNVSMLGHLIEGVVEQDPMSDRYVIRTVDSKGKPVTFDVQEALSKVNGQDVRFTLATLQNLQKLTELAESVGAPTEGGIYPQDLKPG